MKLKFRVSFDTDIEKVRKVIKAVGQELMAREDIGGDFLQPLKSQGVVETDDYGLILRMKFMSEPGKQFIIRRHAFAAVQNAFEEHGIEFSLPELKVAVDRNEQEGATSNVSNNSDSISGAAALQAANTAKGAKA